MNRRVALAPTLLLALFGSSGCDVVDRVLGRSAQAPATDESPTDATPKVAPLTVTEVAYSAGRRWGEACVFAMADNAEAADLAYQQALVASVRAGLGQPAKPSKANGMGLITSIDVPEAKETGDAGVAIAYALGATVTQGVFAGTIGADTKKSVDAIDVYAARVPVPGSEWKAAVEALRSGASKETAKALGDAFDRYFRYDASKTASAWMSTDAPAPAVAPFARTSSEGRYSVTFPFEPTETTRTQDGVEWHETHTTIEIFSVSYADYPDAAQAERALAAYFVNAKAAVVDEADITFAGHKARAATLKAGTSLVLMRAFVVDRRFYKVAAASKADASKPQRFLDSFALTST